MLGLVRHVIVGLAVLICGTVSQDYQYNSNRDDYGRNNYNNYDGRINNNNDGRINNNNYNGRNNNYNNDYNRYNTSRNLPLNNKLLYILIDGFRFDYANGQSSASLPGFSRFVEVGVKADYLTPIFPSISYPDWTTLVTGLWAESHGIVGNYIYDDQANDTFSLFDSSSTGKQKWWTAEPIWTTATKSGLKTAVYRYSRCEILYSNIKPDFCEPYEWVKGPQVFQTTMEKGLNSLQNGYDFVILYEGHPDDVGHEQGPESEARKEAVRGVDQTIQYMLDRIETMGMTDTVNIVIVSDHGMKDVAPGTIRRVQLDDYLLTHYVDAIVDYGAFSNIKVTEGNIDKVYDRLRGMPGVQIYKHDQIPNELHFKNHKYIHDILLVADSNTFIMPSSYYKQIPLKKDNSDATLKGAHGYSPNDANMRGIFYAKGPDFNAGRSLPGIRNVDVYPLLARLLLINPLPNNGSFDTIKSALKYPIPTTTPRNYYDYNGSKSTTLVDVILLVSGFMATRLTLVKF